MARRKGPGTGLLGPDGDAASRNGAAAIRKRGDRLGDIAEVGQPSEDLIDARRKLVIQTNRALILVVDLVGGAAVVVRRPGGGRLRVALEQRERDGIHRAPWNRVAGKRRSARAARRRRIVDDGDPPGDRLGEDPLALQQRGDRRRDRAADLLTLSLIVDEEERAIPDHRPAEQPAVLAAAIVRLRRTGPLEEVPRVQILVPQKAEHTAPESVAA
jgi:hypothetical protein